MVFDSCGSQRRHYDPQPFRVLALLGLLMSEGWRSRFKWNPLRNPSESFLDYLEGYASSFDIYAVCRRRELSSREIDVLAEEFWHYWQEHSASESQVGLGVLEKDNDEEWGRPREPIRQKPG